MAIQLGVAQAGPNPVLEDAAYHFPRFWDGVHDPNYAAGTALSGFYLRALQNAGSESIMTMSYVHPARCAKRYTAYYVVSNFQPAVTTVLHAHLCPDEASAIAEELKFAHGTDESGTFYDLAWLLEAEAYKLLRSS